MGRQEVNGLVVATRRPAATSTRRVDGRFIEGTCLAEGGGANPTVLGRAFVIDGREAAAQVRGGPGEKRAGAQAAIIGRQGEERRTASGPGGGTVGGASGRPLPTVVVTLGGQSPLRRRQEGGTPAGRRAHVG